MKSLSLMFKWILKYAEQHFPPLRFFCITIGEFATNESVRKV